MEDQILDNVDPKTGSLLIDDEEGQREIPLDVRGLRAELNRQRKISQERKNLIAEQNAKLADLGAKASQVDTIQTELATAKELAAKWQEYTAAEATRIAEANAARIAALPEAAKAAFEGVTDPALVSKMLDLVAATTPKEPEAPPIPIGGIATKQNPSGSTLTQEEKAFRDTQPLLATATDAKIRELMKLLKKK